MINQIRQFKAELIQKIHALSYLGFKRKCPNCGACLSSYQDYGNPPRKEAICPWCNSKEPHRLAQLFFKSHTEMFKENGRYIHIAPVLQLGLYLQKQIERSKATYISGDIKNIEDKHIDITNLRFETNSIDGIFACHVMNMLPDDVPGFREVFRVLKPSGWAILQVPLTHELTSVFNPQNSSERLQNFRDQNIYRLYTPDSYRNKAIQAGFKICETFNSQSLSSKFTESAYCFNETIFVLSK